MMFWYNGEGKGLSIPDREHLGKFVHFGPSVPRYLKHSQSLKLWRRWGLYPPHPGFWKCYNKPAVRNIILSTKDTYPITLHMALLLWHILVPAGREWSSLLTGESICLFYLYMPCKHLSCKWWGIYYRPRSEGDNVLGSVRPSVRPSSLSQLNRLTYDLDIRFKVFGCVSSNRADAVDRFFGGFLCWVLMTTRQPQLYSQWQKQVYNRRTVRTALSPTMTATGE